MKSRNDKAGISHIVAAVKLYLCFPIGARLVRINGEDIDPTLDLDKLDDALFNKNCKKTASLTFRNENWNLDQTDLLDKAVAKNA